ncbi:MAG: restriction endonuclease [Candidatus Aureabacteria bacterium]|nr:restriction endonuclease [Candidatus Auribacterota bacterium]
MPNYDFRTLSPVDFEVVVRDLLQEELGLTLQSFTTGRDGGIDFRHSRNAKNNLIVQCKHYVESGYDALLHVLATNELPKLARIKPERYIVATSVPLNPAKKDEIVRALHPFIKCADDVYGKDDLNNLLGKFEQVERKTIKLWLFSLPLLEEVLHAAVRNFSNHELDRIREHAKLYVQNESFDEAAHILEHDNFCIIAGIPGIGKTILAEMLILHYSRAGFEVIKVSEDIAEAWEFKAPETRRVFYYDDFLGQTSFSEKLRKNEDQRIIDFIHAIRKTTGIKLILTTREYVLRQAYQQYEKLNREGFTAQKCIVDLAKYTRMNRARILFNHIYFSALPTQYRASILADKNYLRIIDHRNYSPRIVQLLTEFARLRDVPPARYIEFFMNSMENPLALWEHAFSNQLSQAARNLLLVLASMPHQCFIRDAEKAYQSYNLAYAKKYAATIGPQDYRSALKELEGDFLSYNQEGAEILVRFQNPSVADFVKKYLLASDAEFTLLFLSVVFYEQLDSLWAWRDRRPLLYGLIQANSKTAEQMFRRLLSGEPCRVINMRRGNVDSRERWPHAIESRLALFAEIAADAHKPLLSFVRETFPLIESRIAKKEFDRDGLADLVDVLTTLTDDDFRRWTEPFMEKAIDGLLVGSRWADDLRPLCRLVQSRPGLFPDEKMDRVAATIQEVAESVASDYADLDADALREEAEALESLSKVVKLDIEADIAAIREHADEREQDSSRSDDDVDFSSSESRQDEVTKDEDIASMFSTLNLQP